MPTPARPVTLLLLALAACGDGGAVGDASAGSSTVGEAGSTGAGESTGTTATGDGATTGAEAGVTYWRDVKPVLDVKCATCHRPGDIAPFSITTYDEAQKMAPAIAESIAAGTMPPWSPSPACNTYKHDRSLSADQRARVLEWIAAGAPEGDPADEPAAPEPEAPIAYDLELGIAEPFTPTAYPDEYHCFLLDWPKQADSYATTFDIVPNERSIVHHVIAYVLPEKELAAFEALDAADPGPGYPCYGGPGGEASQKAQWLGAWAPGGSGGALPEGTGIRVAPGSKIALQMHYHPLPGAKADQSRIMVRTADSVEHPAYLLPLAHPGWMVDSPEMTIPAGEPDVVHSFEVDLTSAIAYLFPGSPFGIGQAVRAHAAGVHMHTLGTRASLTVLRDGVPGCLIDVPHWDFNWQGTYQLAAPVRVGINDTVRLECHFDNSKGDEAVKWGERTSDEMCLGMLYVSAL